MKESERCRHPDCIYRNRSDPAKSGNCDYLRLEGKSRTASLPERLKLPANCPFYVPDGTTPPETPTTWKDMARRLYDAGATDREIADTLGKSIQHIGTTRRRAWKLPPNPDKRGPDERIDYARATELYRNGLNDREIAKCLGCSTSAIVRWRYKYELLPIGKRGRKPEKGGCT